MDMTESVTDVINQRQTDIDTMQAQINSGTIDKKEVKRLTKEIAKLEKLNKKSKFWGGVSNKLETKGAQLQETGKSMQKAGLKTTAVVWTPAIYAGYKIAKNVKGKSAESDLVTLVKECEQAHADGKITEVEMKEYVVSFVDNYYRK